MIFSHTFLAGHRGREMDLKALLKNRVGVLRPSLGVTRAKGPAHTSLGQRPRSRVPKYNPSANGAAQFPKSLSGGYRFRILAANCSAEFASRIKAWAEFDERSGFD